MLSNRPSCRRAGRWIDLLAGLALSYRALSGIVLYYRMWRRRKDAGRGAVVWK